MPLQHHCSHSHEVSLGSEVLTYRLSGLLNVVACHYLLEPQIPGGSFVPAKVDPCLQPCHHLSCTSTAQPDFPVYSHHRLHRLSQTHHHSSPHLHPRLRSRVLTRPARLHCRSTPFRWMPPQTLHRTQSRCFGLPTSEQVEIFFQIVVCGPWLLAYLHW